jgi:hypothetical protein
MLFSDLSNVIDIPLVKQIQRDNYIYVSLREV